MWGQESFTLCYSRQLPRKIMPRKTCCVCQSKTTLGNGTIVGEVLQCRCSAFFGKNVCIGDIMCQKCRRKVYRIEKSETCSIRIHCCVYIYVPRCVNVWLCCELIWNQYKRQGIERRPRFLAHTTTVICFKSLNIISAIHYKQTIYCVWSEIMNWNGCR